jgi:hypothetical protein
VGWTWFAYNWQPMNKYAVVDEGKGLKGSAASCAELQANGGMTWACRWVHSCCSFTCCCVVFFVQQAVSKDMLHQTCFVIPVPSINGAVGESRILVLSCDKYAVVDVGKGLQGSAASCAELQANGGVTWGAQVSTATELLACTMTGLPFQFSAQRQRYTWLYDLLSGLLPHLWADGGP